MASIKCDFFQVAVPQNCGRTFEQLINEVAQMPDDETRTVEWYDKTLIRLRGVLKTDGVLLGEMVRTEMENLPSKSNRKGVISRLNLADDEGTARRTHFLYHEPTKTIVIHKSQTGVAPRAIRHYFEGFCGCAGIAFSPWLDTAAMKKLAGSDGFRSLEVTVATTANL
ncbi:MAG TPA: DUF6731 family protein, partial [Capsulimonadaceae bacterium]|nr:DUF6731 family protein [Capsulimonadaceae bacterium]